MDRRTVIDLLLLARNWDITISYREGSVKMSSIHPSDHPLSIEIRERSEEVKQFYSELQSRLRKGQSWLIKETLGQGRMACQFSQDPEYIQ